MPSHQNSKQAFRIWPADPEYKLLFVLVPLLVILPVLIGDSFIYHVFITICLYGALATAWNIVGGYAGQLSFGHAIFYGLGAYASTLLALAGITPWLGMLVGAAVATVVAVLISWPCFRLRGPFFALATIAFLEVIRRIALHFSEWTGGAAGKMVPLRLGWEWMIFRERWPSLVIAAGLLLLTLLVAGIVRRRRFGYYLVATRERESAAQASGINTTGAKLGAVGLSAALTAMMGAFHAMYLTFVEPEAVFSLVFSIQIAMFALIGGIGTLAGPLLGTLLVVPLTELARGWLGAGALGLHGFVYGVVLMLIVLYMPDGFLGYLQTRLSRWFGEPEPADAQADPGASTTPRDISVPATPHVIGEPLLVASDLHKRFGGLQVTNGLSLEIRQGEILGIIGPNGAGKTTLFNMLSGVLPPDSGTVRIRDEQGAWSSPGSAYAFARAGLGRTFQIVQPFAAMSVLDNILVGAYMRHPDPADAREKALSVADRMGLWQYRHTQARNLPIGGLKRLEMARVMATEPRILLLDEVMAGLNQADVAKAIDLVLEIRASGVTIVAIEHVMKAIMALSDRIVVINAGGIIANGAPTEVVQNPAVIQAYLGEDFHHAQA